LSFELTIQYIQSKIVCQQKNRLVEIF